MRLCAYFFFFFLLLIAVIAQEGHWQGHIGPRQTPHLRGGFCDAGAHRATAVASCACCRLGPSVGPVGVGSGPGAPSSSPGTSLCCLVSCQNTHAACRSAPWAGHQAPAPGVCPGVGVYPRQRLAPGVRAAVLVLGLHTYYPLSYFLTHPSRGDSPWPARCGRSPAGGSA
jgi:hypothetical protein